jgi:hypothetical protein
MRRILQITALVIALSGAAYWTATGANRGWTKTTVPVKTVDPVTGLDGIEYRKQFIPGVDFLAVVELGAAFLVGASLFIRKTSTK